jgi:beta-glucanase (GH16 family)
MMRRLVPVALGFLLGVVMTLWAVSDAMAGVHNCRPAWKCNPPPPSVAPPSPTATSVAPTLTPTGAPTAPAGYTFADEFTSGLNPAWHRTMTCCGSPTPILDPALATVSGGYLHIKAERRSGGWATYLLDTNDRFEQLYGYFEARMKIPKGKGFWPAFWMYPGSTSDEIDAMEVCANPIGTNGGNDVTLLHTYAHWDGGAQQGHGTRTVDLSLAFHVYAAEWRRSGVVWYLDGVEVFRWADVNGVVNTPMAVLVNLGVGGSWCSAPDATTPSPSELLVDWIRVRP